MNEKRDLLERPIPGVTAKQVIAFVVLISGCVIGYVDIKNGIIDNRRQAISAIKLMEEIREEFKQDRKLDDARLRVLELQISECKTRLDIMDKFVEGYNKSVK